MKKSNKKGFTIIELVIVIAVIAILAAVLIPTFSNVIKKANQSKALQEARNAYTEIMADDIADGVQDNKIGSADDAPVAVTVKTSGDGVYVYTIASGVVTYQYKTNGFVVDYSSSTGAWTVSDAPAA